MVNNFQDKANFIWTVADDILRGTFKPHEYGDVILPFVVLRRLDCVHENCKDAVYEAFTNLEKDCWIPKVEVVGNLDILHGNEKAYTNVTKQ